MPKHTPVLCPDGAFLAVRACFLPLGLWALFTTRLFDCRSNVSLQITTGGRLEVIFRMPLRLRISQTFTHDVVKRLRSWGFGKNV